MFIRITRRVDLSVDVELVGENGQAIRVYDFSRAMSATQPIKDLLEVLKDFPVVCLEESITITPVELDSFMIYY